MNKQLLDEFIGKVEAKLPDYIKKNEAERNDVLGEIRERVLDIAEELSGGGEVTDAVLEAAITRMGLPGAVAGSYRRTGTPKLLISQELWPFYKTLLLIVFGALVLGNVVAMIIGLLSGDGPLAVLQMAGGIQGGFFAAFTIVTLIFFWLSHQGYVPQDFDENAKEPGKEAKKRKEPFSRKGKLVEAGIGIVVATVTITMPFPSLVALMNPAFVVLVQWIGVIWLACSVLNLAEALVGTERLLLLQLLRFVQAGIGLLTIVPVALMAVQPGIVPYIHISGELVVASTMPAELLPIAVNGLYAIIGIIIFATVVDVIETILLKRKVTKLSA